jgi:hypothetical protein
VLTAFAKNSDDVVVLKNGDRLTGEIKGLQRGELRIKADYMAEAVRLDWTKVETIESKSAFLILLVDGKLVTDVMRLSPRDGSDGADFIIGSSQQSIRVQQLDVIRITPADKQFWKSLEGSIDFGFSFTSGNDSTKLNLPQQLHIARETTPIPLPSIPHSADRPKAPASHETSSPSITENN